MKPWLRFCIGWMICLMMSAGLAYAGDWPPYMHAESLPNGVEFLPPPPDINSEPFKTDLYYYRWGKDERNTLRGELAREDANCSATHLSEIFSEPMGITISEEKTPKLYNLIGRGGYTAMSATSKPKSHHARTRPYAEFNEPSLIPDAEAKHNSHASYPSGHATISWAVALLLVEINPAAQDALLKRAYEFGESRVIAGYHYESDVVMGRLVASAAVARMHADSEFLADMNAAKKEFRLIMAKKTGSRVTRTHRSHTNKAESSSKHRHHKKAASE